MPRCALGAFTFNVTGAGGGKLILTGKMPKKAVTNLNGRCPKRCCSAGLLKHAPAKTDVVIACVSLDLLASIISLFSRNAHRAHGVLSLAARFGP